MGIPDEVLIANPELVIELAEKDLKNKVPIFDFDSLPKELMQNAKIKELSEKQSFLKNYINNLKRIQIKVIK